VETISSGALAVDLALGVGGLPRGRVTEIFGPEMSGKTTLALHVVAEAQRNGGICAFIDAEHALDPAYARAIGIDVDELLISQPDTGEQALEITDMLIRSGALDVVVIDSVAALTPKAEIEGEMGAAHVGLQARLMSQALRKITHNLNKSKTICIFINQLREKIGVLFGSPETTPGGRALKFYSSVRLDVRRIEAIKDGVEVVGNRTRVKVVKNKCVAAGTTVFDPTTGLTHRIEDIVERGEGATVMAADKAGRLHVRKIGERFAQGEQDVIGLCWSDGTELWVTPDHKVLTEVGWKEAGGLAAADRVARPRYVHGGSQRNDLPVSQTEPVLAYLRGRGVTPTSAAQIVGDGAGDPQGGLQRVLGDDRLRRDRVERIADALGSDFLREVLEEQIWYDPIVEIRPAERRATYDIEVDELHNFVADGVVVHNCAPPFRQAEFDIMYGKGISREGSILDISVDLGIVKKSGAWFTYDDEQLGQGRENAKQFLAENPELMVEISELIRKDVYGDQEGAVEVEALDEGDVSANGDAADDEPITLD
jgi:protein RecA